MSSAQHRKAEGVTPLVMEERSHLGYIIPYTADSVDTISRSSYGTS